MSVSTNSSATATSAPTPPILSRLMSGTFWLALRTPLHALFGFLTIPLLNSAIGPRLTGAYYFAWGFGFFQTLLEFGMSSALARRVSEASTRGDEDAVDRAVACGLAFYGVMAGVQMAALLAVRYFALPLTEYSEAELDLIVKLIWLQVLTAPCYGLSMVLSSVLQAHHRYDVFPRCEIAVVILRFAILAIGLSLRFDFFAVVVAMTVAQIAVAMGPAIAIMVWGIGYVPKLRAAQFSEFGFLMRTSLFVFVLQLSFILGEKVDTSVIGWAMNDPGPATTVYTVVSKPFLTIRQVVTMLTALLVPAVASLAVAGNWRELDRVKYDASRLLIAFFAPVAFLAWIYAPPFLSLWMDPSYREAAWLMRLFLIAVLPLSISVLVQMAIGMGDVKFIAITALFGALINLPLSYMLCSTTQSVSGVIWGTVLTTLFSNLLIPAVHLRRVLDVRLKEFASRSLAAPMCGCLAIGAVALALQLVLPAELPDASRMMRAALLGTHLSVGCLAFAAGYLAVPAGRGDWSMLVNRLRPRLRWSVPNDAAIAKVNVNSSPLSVD